MGAPSSIKAWLVLCSRQKGPGQVMGRLFILCERRKPPNRSTYILQHRNYKDTSRLTVAVEPKNTASCLRLCSCRPGS